MQDKVTFEYAVIRVVPKVEREEFFNVAVLLYCKRKRFLDIQYVIDPQKLEAFTHELDFELLNAHLHSWTLICKCDPDGGAIGKLELADRFRWLAACRSTVIQSSKTHSGLCEDPQAELEGL